MFDVGWNCYPRIHTLSSTAGRATVAKLVVSRLPEPLADQDRNYSSRLATLGGHIQYTGDNGAPSSSVPLGPSIYLGGLPPLIGERTSRSARHHCRRSSPLSRVRVTDTSLRSKRPHGGVHYCYVILAFGHASLRV